MLNYGQINFFSTSKTMNINERKMNYTTPMTTIESFTILRKSIILTVLMRNYNLFQISKSRKSFGMFHLFYESFPFCGSQIMW